MRNIDKRYIAAGVAVVLLAGLLYWQHRRTAAVADCVELGGRWDGASSRCDMPGGRILIRPDLRRG